MSGAYRSRVTTALGVAAGYTALFRLGMELAIPPGNVTAVFPASGWALGCLLSRGGDAVAGVWLGSLLGNLLLVPVGANRATQAGLALLLASGAALQAVAQGRWLRRRSGGVRLLESPGGVLYFTVIGGLAGCLVSSTIGVGGLLAAGQVTPAAAGFTWLTWWLGDAAGVLLAGAAMLAWPLRGPPRRPGEALGLLATTGALGALMLRDVLPMSHFLLPPLFWAAYRFGPRETTLVQILIALIGLGTAVRSAGVYKFYTQAQSLLLLQSFLTLSAVFGLTLAAVVQRQRRVERELHEANEGLRERTRDLEARNEQLRAAVVQRSDLLDGMILSQRGDELSSNAPLPAGTVVGGRARVVRLIDRGGMGDVYEAVDLIDGRPVALKLQRGQASLDEDALRRFVAEARSAASIDHPAVVRVYHLDVTDQGKLFLLLELVAGESLAQRLERPSPLPLGACLRIGAAVAEALSAAHAAGIVHRDIKPANIMLTPDSPGLKVLDFGIARRFDASPASARLTEGLMLLGTPAYMAPEQIRDPSAAGPPCDVYSLGVVLFRLLTGRLPFERSTRADVLSAHLLDPLPPLLVPVPPAVDVLLSAMTAKEPAERPDAPAVARALREQADALRVPPMEVLYAEEQAPASVDTLVAPLTPP